MDIFIRTIPHAEQRYDTVGDWWFTPDGNIEIRVSDMGDWKKEALIAVHELTEVLLCKARGISQADVDAFDKNTTADEPGGCREAPYHKEHMYAYAAELGLMVEMGVDFNEYAEAVEAL